MEDWIPKLCWGSFPLNPDCSQHTEFPDRVMWQLYAGNVQEGQDYKALEKVSLLVYALSNPLNPRTGSNLGIHPSIFACPWRWWQDDADPSWNCAQGSIYPRHLSIRALMHRDWQPLTLTSTPTANLDPCYPVRLYVSNKSFSIHDIVWFQTWAEMCMFVVWTSYFLWLFALLSKNKRQVLHHLYPTKQTVPQLSHNWGVYCIASSTASHWAFVHYNITKVTFKLCDLFLSTNCILGVGVNF